MNHLYNDYPQHLLSWATSAAKKITIEALLASRPDVGESLIP